MNKRGYLSTYLLIMVTVIVIIVLLLFGSLIFFSNIYSIVYDYKLDLYNLTRKAVVTVNKEKGSYGVYEYNEEEYIKLLKQDLQKIYNLNVNLENGKKYITKIDILEYKIYKKGSIDSVTKKSISEDTIHIVTNIRFNPIVFKFLFNDGCKFKVHNDIKIELSK